VLADSPADEAGIQVGTEIVAINGIPIADAVEDTEACWAWPFSAEHYKRYQQLRYVTRFPLGADVSITFLDAEAGEVTAEMTAEAESESFTFSSLNRGL